MVFILKNRNNNLIENAIVYFTSLKDLLTAKESTLYYFHNKLEWSENKCFEVAKSMMNKENQNISVRRYNNKSNNIDSKQQRIYNKYSYKTKRSTSNSSKQGSRANSSVRSCSNTRKPLINCENNREDEHKYTTNIVATGSNRIVVSKEKGKQVEVEESKKIEKILAEMQERFRTIEQMLANRS